ncbi:hypothetical protein ACIA7S_28230 [Streptomyces sp. NPDC051643]|uniref:hypothetical protein n=1 Tax=Streptomyces sp. NPDC051643 TaxID=3365665 RepID=UPI0037974927
MLSLNDLHDFITDLEGEGHSLAGRLRDLFDRIKTDVTHLVGDGENELERFTRGLVDTLVPELAKVKDQVVAEVKAELKAVEQQVIVTIDGTQLAPEYLAEVVDKASRAAAGSTK